MATATNRKLKQETLQETKIMKLKIAALLLGAVTLSIAAPAHADNLSDQMEKMFAANSGDIFYNTTLFRQGHLLLNFPTVENEYHKDSQAIEKLYRDGLTAQTGTPISTADLPNPFSSSLNTNPRFLGR
jgi:hypothetical protein